MAEAQVANQDEATRSQAVRFNSATEEISPNITSDSLQQVHTVTDKDRSELSEAQKKELQDLSVSVQQSRLQSARMDQFVFDPVSLPPSRVSEWLRI